MLTMSQEQKPSRIRELIGSFAMLLVVSFMYMTTQAMTLNWIWQMATSRDLFTAMPMLKTCSVLSVMMAMYLTKTIG